MLYPILLIEVGISPIDIMAMTRYLMYTYKINDMRNERLAKIALNSSKNRLHLKRCWCKDTIAWLNHWGINENDILQNIDNVKNIITSKFKEKFQCEENLVVKRKLRYYKEITNPKLEDLKYLLVVTSSQKKINIAKIRMNSHELHSKTRRWSIPKIPREEKVCHLCESMNVEDENHFLLQYLAYTHIKSQFHGILYDTNLYNLLTCQNYSEVGKLLGRNNILN